MTHIITLSFDDGFRDSSIRTADIFEKHGLKACLNVLASQESNERFRYDIPTGDFDLWNDIQASGHEIMPHGWNHTNKTEVSFSEAQELFGKCFETFERELDGYKTENAIFNFPYNASNAEIEEWLAPQVRAYRTGGGFWNSLPNKDTKRLTCSGFGPDCIDEHLIGTIDDFLNQDTYPWMIYNTHGLDNEGWGPVQADTLDTLLERLCSTEGVEVLTPSQVFDRYQSD